jgi:glycosyltransferase involved in cell wall biosynthesis
MKVLYFTRGQSPHDLRFTEALSKTEHQVFVLCIEADEGREWPDGITEIKWAGLRNRYTVWKHLRLVPVLVSLIRAIQPDLIHAGPIQSVAFLVALVRFHPLVSMSWGSDLLFYPQRNKIARLITRFTLDQTDVLVGDCGSVGLAAQRFGFSTDRYRMFPWGVDLAHFSPQGSSDLRKKLGWENKIVLLSNRTMELLYDVETIAHAFVGASKTNPDLRLMLFGTGSREAKVKQILCEGGVEERVHFGGIVSKSDLPDVYRSSDFYLSASQSDGSSVSLMEAMACGLPAIVSDIPGNREWVEDGVQGWLFETGNSDELVEKILFAVNHPADIPLIKKQSRQIAEDRADWSKNFPKLLEAYQFALEIHNKENSHG